MLSKYDIQKEMLKTNICVVPFNYDNIKENSVNLCTSEFAYTFGSYNGAYKGKTINLKEKGSAVVGIDGKDKIIFLPHVVTLIETKEVICVPNNIGGSYHSKVGIAMKGIGHIGTMLGPNFKGHSLIALTNNTDEIITLDVGESFVSITFNYLKTPITEENPTRNGHEDKFGQFGIEEPHMQILNEDWKSKTEEIKKRFKNEEDFKLLKADFSTNVKDTVSGYVSLRNLIIVLLLIVIIASVIVYIFIIDDDYKANLINGLIIAGFTSICIFFAKKIKRKY